MDPNKYLNTLSTIKQRLIKNERDTERFINEFSVNSYVPLVAVMEYAMRPDVLGPLPWLVESNDRLKKFYGYTEIVPWKDLV